MQATAGPAIQNIHHPAADVADVHAALPDVFIIHIVEAPGEDLLGPFHRGGASGTGSYVVTDLIGEGFVLQQGDLEQ